jgi:hypothetical protein
VNYRIDGNDDKIGITSPDSLRRSNFLEKLEKAGRIVSGVCRFGYIRLTL